MSEKARLRLFMAARIAGSWLTPLAALLFWGGEGIWLAMLLGASSLPLIGIACGVGFAFAPSIARHPLPWAAGALFVSLCAGFYVAGKAGLAFGAFVAVPATGLFLFSLRQWPHRTEQPASSRSAQA